MRRLTIALLTVLLTALAACSNGEDPPAPEPAGDVTVSTPPDSPSPSPSPTPSTADDFDTAVKFVELVHDPDRESLSRTRDLIQPESAAARYVAHQTLLGKAQAISGYSPTSTTAPTIKPNRAKGTVTVTQDAVEGETRGFNYTWKDFTFDRGKLTGWTGASGPVGSVLWTRQTTDESRGRKAVLKSAYRTNTKSMNIVVELSSTKGTSFSDAEYAAKDGYRQALTEQNASDLSSGEKTLAYFVFDDAQFGGRLHIPYYDEDGTSQGDWELDLAVK